MANTHPKLGPGHFQWYAGGWFGAQFGATLWILLSGLVFVRSEPLLAALLVACSVAANLIGVALWSLRGRFLPYPALQCLVGSMGISAAAALIITDVFGRLSELEPRLADSPSGPYGLLVLYPLMMIIFHLQERAALRAARGNV
jgi:hypothetical protein